MIYSLCNGCVYDDIVEWSETYLRINMHMCFFVKEVKYFQKFDWSGYEIIV